MNITEELKRLIEDGGWIFPPLLLCAFCAWWCIGTRLYRLWIPKGEPEEILDNPKKFAALGEFASRIRGNKNRSLATEADWIAFEEHIFQYKGILQTFIAIAPLLGLLGTVTGMIETFKGLGGSQLFSQSGGVAGGVAQALLTTQIGLVVAAPAIIMARYCDRCAARTLQRAKSLIMWIKTCEE